MSKLGTAFVDVEPDLKGFGRGLDAKMRRAGSRAGKGFFDGFGRETSLRGRISSRGFSGIAVAAHGAAAGVGGLAAAGAYFIKQFEESNKVAKQTRAVLKSTGGAARVTDKHVSGLATKISRLAGVDDEAIQSGENLLLTFRGIRNETGKGNKIFDRATLAVTDMSAALGQDLKSSAIQLGKALNDPVKGVTALQRVGVSFTKSQRDQIKTLVETGHTLKAQKIILAEINAEFGGSAEKTANPFNKLKTSVGNLAEAIGGALAPKVEKVANDASHFVDQMVDGTGAGGRFAKQMRDLAGDLKPVLTTLKDIGGFAVKNPKLLAVALGGIAGFKVLSKVRGIGGSLSKTLVGKATPVPVFVTNKGFGLPGGGPGGKEPIPAKVPGAVKTGAKVLAAVSGPEVAAVLGPLILADIANRRSKVSQRAAALNEVLPAGREDLARQLDAAVKAGSPEKLRKVAAAIELTAQDMRGMGSAAKSASREVLAIAGNARDLAKAEDRARAHAEGLARSIDRVARRGDFAKGSIQRLHDEISNLPTNVRVNIIANAVAHFGKGGKSKFGPNFSTGGLVPGHGNRDSVKANLMPGEYVLRKRVVSKVGLAALEKLNSAVGQVGGRTREFPGFQKFDDVFVNQAGLKGAIRSAAHAPAPVIGGKLTVRPQLPTYTPGTPGAHTRSTVVENVNISAPAAAVPDPRHAAALFSRELARIS